MSKSSSLSNPPRPSRVEAYNKWKEGNGSGAAAPEGEGATEPKDVEASEGGDICTREEQEPEDVAASQDATATGDIQLNEIVPVSPKSSDLEAQI